MPPSHSSVLLSVSRSAAPPSLNCCCCCSLTAGGGSSPTCCANLLLQCLQHTDQLAFKYVVRRVSELQARPSLHRPAEVPAREAGSSGPAIRNPAPGLPTGRNRASRGRFPARAAALLLPAGCFPLQQGATHLFCKPHLPLLLDCRCCKSCYVLQLCACHVRKPVIVRRVPWKGTTNL